MSKRIRSGAKHPRPTDSDEEDVDVSSKSDRSISAEARGSNKRVKITNGKKNLDENQKSKTRRLVKGRRTNRLEEIENDDADEQDEESEVVGVRANDKAAVKNECDANGFRNEDVEINDQQAQEAGENEEEGDVAEEGEENEDQPSESESEDSDYNIGGENPNHEKHVPGAIVRVKMVNFVTYTRVEFFPGPSLNMVIGPNGTGKSTLVCAICLGLGWGPNHLGRAKEIREFVKHKCKEATIEIELQAGVEHKVNPIIKRTIQKEDNKSHFEINGKTATLKAVQELVQKYSIQIDNLCQFLPQDKVCEFAALNSVDLLRETQRAAAPPKVLQWHEKLKAIGVERKVLAAEYEKDWNELQNLQSRQSALEQDVQRLRERQKVLREIELYEKAKPFAKYRIAREYAKEAKARLRAVRKEYEELKAEEEPSLRKFGEKNKYKTQVEKGVTDTRKVVNTKATKIQQCKLKLDKLDENVSQVKAEKRASTEAEKNRRLEISRLRNRITQMEQQWSRNKPEEMDISSFNQRIQAKNHEHRELTAQAEDLKRKTLTTQDEEKLRRQGIADCKAEIQRLESQAGQREQLLRQISQDSHAAWQWLKENKDKFEKEVFGPPIVTCSVKEPKYADAIEHLISNSYTAFTCQTRNDYKLLAAHLFGDRKAGIQGLGLADVSITEFSGTNAPTLADQRGGPSGDDCRKFGFGGIALEFIEGPEAVLNMMCHNSMIHQTPISLQNFDASRNKQLESQFGSWVAGNQVYKVIWRREYGDDAKTTSVKSIRRAKYFSTQQVDQEAKRKQQEKIKDLELELEQLKEEANNYNNERSRVRQKMEEVKAERDNAQQVKLQYQERLRRWQKLESQIELDRKKLEEAEGGKDKFKIERERSEQKLRKLSIDRVKAALEYAALVIEHADLSDSLRKLLVWEVEANSDLLTLQELNKEIDLKLKEKQREVEGAQREAEVTRKKAIELQEQVTALVAEMELTDEEKQYLDDLNQQNLSLDEIDARREALTARLNLLHDGNPNAIQEYEKREKQIAKNKAKIEEKKSKLDSLDFAVNEIKGKWEDQLDKVIKKISKAFSKSFNKIGCAGEVRIHKDEDGFDKWAIEILVKFREAEKLQILNSQRQSGGERAVSTVFYLMALQSLARAPFRVVDEINQGMDPRNERLVHARMVNIACRKHTSQYFLITPKLLPDLKYHRRMKVHVINSGDWVEEEYKFDIGKCLQIGKAMKQREMVLSN